MDANPLASFPLFHDLPEEAIEAIQQVSRQRDYPSGTVLFQEGQSVKCIHIVLEGAVEIFKALDSGDEQHLALRHPGDSLGEISLFISNQVRSASGRANGPVRALEVAIQDMELLVHKHPEIAMKLVGEISQRMRDSESQLFKELRARNQALEQALIDLRSAHEQLVSQEKTAHELVMAHNIQHSLLPKEIPSFPGWQIHADWKPARAVSGDFYDFIDFPDGKLGLVIGDVTGKGVPAALFMAITRSVLHAVTDSVTDTQLTTPGEILSRVNNILCKDMPPFMFVTCQLAVINPGDGRLSLANAGHVLPIQIGPDGMRDLRAVGLPLGLFPDQVFDSIHTQVGPGDHLFFLSDGWIEAHNPQQVMFGSQRFKERLRQCYAQAANDGQTVISNMMSELCKFTGEGWEQEDDLTFVSIMRS